MRMYVHVEFQDRVAFVCKYVGLLNKDHKIEI